MTLKAAVIGCGRIGCGFDDDPRRGYVSTHAGAYAKNPNVNLVALVDIDAERLNRYKDKFGVPNAYTDHREMLRQESPDLVSICTLSGTHLEITRNAVDGGVKAIFCEKPIADSVEAADEMIRICRDRGVILLIDHQRRFDPFHQRVRSFLQQGRLGRIQQVTAYYTAGIANTGTHLIDMLRFLLGDVASVLGMYSVNTSPNPEDRNLDGWLTFQSGVRATLQACDVRSYLIFEITILGTSGRMRITSSGFGIEYEAAVESPRFAGYNELIKSDSPVALEAQREDMLRAVEHLVKCVNGEDRPISSGIDGRGALEVIVGLHQSASQNGLPVCLPLAASEISLLSR